MNNLPLSIMSDKILLREFIESDGESVQKYAVLPEVYEFMPWGPNTEEQTQQFINLAIQERDVSPRMKYQFAIILDKKSLIGSCGIKVDPLNEGNCEIGYCLSSEYWGKSIASQAVKLLINFSIKELKMHRVFAVVDPNNVRSVKLVERLNFRKEGKFKEHKHIRSKWHDSLVYAIIRNEWPST